MHKTAIYEIFRSCQYFIFVLLPIINLAQNATIDSDFWQQNQEWFEYAIIDLDKAQPREQILAQIRVDAIRQHIDNTPENVSKAPEDLARHIESGTENDYEKAYAVFRWIAENLRYDHHGWDTQKQSYMNPEDILQYRTAVCAGYSVLYRKLLGLMGVEAVYMRGLVKNELPLLQKQNTQWSPQNDEWLGRHAWNVVKLDGAWYFVDCTWGNKNYEKSTGALLRDVEDYYFIVEPDELIGTHFPEYPIWQLLESPIEKQQFVQAPIVHKAYYQHRIGFSEPLSLILDGDNMNSLTFSADKNTIFKAHIQDGDSTFANGFTLIQREGENISLLFDYPFASQYDLHVMGRAARDTAWAPCFSCKVHQASKNDRAGSALPVAFNGLFQELGIRLVSDLSQLSQVDSVLELAFEAPPQQFLTADIIWEDVALPGYLTTMQPEGSLVKIFARLPGPGRYTAFVKTRDIQQTEGDAEYGMKIDIKSTQPVRQLLPFVERKDKHHLKPLFEQNAIMQSDSSEVLKFLVKADRLYYAFLQDTTGQNIKDATFIRRFGDTLLVSYKLPHAGEFLLEIFDKPDDPAIEKLTPSTCYFLQGTADVQKAPLFPETVAEIQKHNIKLLNNICQRTVIDSTINIKLAAPSDQFNIIGQLMSSVDTLNIQFNHSSDVAQALVQCPRAGEYQLNLFGRDQSKEEGYFFLYGFPITAKHSLRYFKNSALPPDYLSEIGISTDLESCILQTDSMATLHFKLEKKTPLVAQLIDAHGDLVEGHTLVQRNGGKSIIHTSFPAAGRYQLFIYAKMNNEFQRILEYIISAKDAVGGQWAFPESYSDAQLYSVSLEPLVIPNAITNNEFSIKVNAPADMNISTNVITDSTRLPNIFARIVESGETKEILYTLPHPDEYTIVVFAGPKNQESIPAVYKFDIAYQSDEKQPAAITLDHDFYAKDISLIEPSSRIASVDSMITLRLKAPEHIYFVTGLFEADQFIQTTNFSNIQRNGQDVSIHQKMPQHGDFTLCLYAGDGNDMDAEPAPLLALPNIKVKSNGTKPLPMQTRYSQLWQIQPSMTSSHYIACDSLVALDFSCMPGTELFCNIKRQDSNLEGPVSMIYRLHEQQRLVAKFPEPDEYELLIFASQTEFNPDSSIFLVYSYLIQSNVRPAYPSLPYITDTDRNFELREPLLNELHLNKSYTFKVDVPGAQQVVMLHGPERIQAQKTDDFFEATVDIRHPELKVTAVYPAEEKLVPLILYRAK